jgi:lysine-specific demethylase 8
MSFAFVLSKLIHKIDCSQVDLEQSEDAILKSFPEFSRARGFECILDPGDLLYIPPSCWHFVRSLSTSFSVSFWFQ